MAEIHIQQNTPLLHNSFMANEAEHSTIEGKFQGQAVVVKNTASTLADAAEELTFSASETVEKELSERKTEKKDKHLGLQEIEAIIEKLGDIDKKQMESLLRALKALLQGNSKEILGLTQQEFKDPTHQHAALSWIKEQVSNLPELKAEVEKAITELENTQKAEINAGYNIAGIEISSMKTSPESRRILYRDIVLDFEDYSKTFLALTEKYPPQEMGLALNFLLTGLGADMAATEPSCEKAQLKEVMDALYMVKTLATFYSDTSKLLNNLEKSYNTSSPSPNEIMEPVLKYKDMPMLLDSQIMRDMPFLTSALPSKDVELTQGVRELIRSIPHKTFHSLESRQQILDAFQNLLDNAINREEME